eukprot:COSAG02_NODE_3834_length_6173_cov_6.023708_2_plen_117_part_00
MPWMPEIYTTLLILLSPSIPWAIACAAVMLMPWMDIYWALLIILADRSSADDFATKKRAFEELHKNRDSQYTFTTDFDVSSHEIPDETQEVVVWEDEVAKPRCLNTRCVAHSIQIV